MTHVRFGGHLSANPGLRQLVLAARALGYSALQTTVGGDRDYEPREIDPSDASEYRKMTFGVATYVHLPFIINPCEPVPQRRGFYKRAFKTFCNTATLLGTRGVVLHPGFRKDLTVEEATVQLVKFLDDAIDEEWTFDVLLETDAGSKNGSAVGSPEFIVDVITRLELEKVAMCVDTCHMFGRGINLWDPAVLQEFMSKYARYTKLVHLNSPDPGLELGGNRDRHNTPFVDRTDLDPTEMIRVLVGRFPAVMERTSLAVQEQDAELVRKVMGWDSNNIPLVDVVGTPSRLGV